MFLVSLLSDFCTTILWMQLNSLNPGPLQIERTWLRGIHETEDCWVLSMVQ